MDNPSHSVNRSKPADVATAVLAAFEQVIGSGSHGNRERQIAQRVRAAASLLQTWNLPVVAIEGLILAGLRECDAAQAERLAGGLSAEAGELADRLVTWPAIVRGGDDPEALPSSRQLAIWRASTFREAHLDSPQFTFVLTLVADQDARLTHGPAPSRRQAAVTEGVLVPLLEVLGMWQMRQRWLEQTVAVLDPVAYARVAAVLGPAENYADPAMRRVAAIDEDSAEFDRLGRDERNQRSAARAYLHFEEQLLQRLTSTDIHPRPRMRRTVWCPGATLRGTGNLDWTIEQWRQRLTGRLGVSILCWSVEDCYRVLGVVHGLGRPIGSADGETRFGDPNARPESNGCCALHTAILVADDEGREVLVGVRILTIPMARLNADGVASTFRSRPSDHDSIPAWWNPRLALRVLSHGTAIDGRDEVRALLGANEIGSTSNPLYAFTPDGDIVLLDRSTDPPTALDFAYSIHSELGHRASEIEVDGEPMPLHHPLTNGSLVRVRTDSSTSGPDLGWLRMVTTPFARESIRRELTRRARAVHPARVEIEASLLRTCRLYWKKGYEIEITTGGLDTFVERMSTILGYTSSDALYDAVASRRLLPQFLTDRLVSEELASVVFGNRTPYALHRIHFCNVCRPALNEELVAYERRSGRASTGMTIHLKGCRLVPKGNEPVAVAPSGNVGDRGEMSLFQIFAKDRQHLLGDILQVFYEESSAGVYLHGVDAKTVGDGKAEIKVTVRTAGKERQIAHLQRRLQRMRDVAQVFPHPVTAVERSQLGAAPSPYLNPYTLETVYESPPFCSREEVIGKILTWLETTGPLHPWLLHGQRRVGKTSLARHLAQVALPRFGGVVPVNVDLFELTAAKYSTDGVVGLIVTEFFRALRRPAPRYDPEAGPIEWLVDSMRAALDMAKGRRIVILIDEFNVLLDLEHEDKVAESIFRNLRSIVDQVRDVHWIFIVQDVHYRDFRRWGGAGDLFQIAQPLEVPHLDAHAGEKLVWEPARSVGIDFEQPLPREIYDLTDGNPFLIHAICHRIVNDLQMARRTLVRKDDVEQAVNYVLGNAETFFNHFLVSLDRDRHRVLNVVAEQTSAGEWVSVRRLASLLPGEDTTLATLESLDRLGMLDLDQRDGGAMCRISIPLFHQWLLLPHVPIGGYEPM